MFIEYRGPVTIEQRDGGQLACLVCGETWWPAMRGTLELMPGSLRCPNTANHKAARE